MKRVPCCAGHRCDRCPSCLTGTCCRADLEPATIVWDNLPLSPALFFLRVEALTTSPHVDGRVFNALRRAIRGQPLGTLLLATGEELLSMRGIGDGAIDQIIDAAQALEATTCAEVPADLGGQARAARALAHLVAEVNVTFRQRCTTDRGQEWSYNVGPLRYEPAQRFRALASNQRRAGGAVGGAIYDAAARLLEAGTLAVPFLGGHLRIQESPPSAAARHDAAPWSDQEAVEAANLLRTLHANPGLRRAFLAAIHETTS